MNKYYKVISLSTLLGLVGCGLSFVKISKPVGVKAISVTGCNYVTKLETSIDLNASDESIIRNYYSSLNSLSESERQGTNLLKNLKSILYNMNYFSYSNIWKIYEITDRDWSLSPASGDSYGEYNSSSNTYANYVYGKSKSDSKNNPYIHALYRNNEESGYVKAWDDHNASGINREHVWCQSRGFSGADTSDGAKGPAGTDLHHLIAGDGYVNQSVHNNSPYGYVSDKSSSSKGNKSYNADNYVGEALHSSSSDVASKVFEPQDSDKGDIARAVFYMVARYNNYAGKSGVISDYEPNLKMANFATSDGAKEYSSDTKAVNMGILRDLLVWNKIDPVDEYEKYRNDLIYKNYQGNRNPFVDFPEWADYIWGTATIDSYDPTVTGFAKPASDALYDASLSVDKTSVKLKTNSSTTIKVSAVNGADISWSVTDDSLISLSKSTSHSGEEVTVSSLAKEGSTKITVSATIDEQVVSKEINVTVSNEVVPSEKKFDFKIIIFVGAGVVALIIVIAIIYAHASKKNKRKMKSVAKKTAKKAYKKYK